MSATCYHCGDTIIGKGYSLLKDSEKKFCCSGCKTVYQLLRENNMDSFYQLEQNPGVKPNSKNESKYNFLDVPTIKEKYIQFKDGNMERVTLFLPSIHCSSCIYLLENLTKIESQIISCQVNFTKREATISYVASNYSLAKLALLLDKIGYTPNFGNRKETEKKMNKEFLYKIGFAGFAFGSIMLWSFPEYLGIEDMNEKMRNFTSYLSFIVSLPVLFYSASEYYISALKAIRSKTLNLDIPITIGILALYGQSCYTIFTGGGPGYMDSFATFIFWLLIGKWFQNKTYKTLSFERDYSSYFPVAVTKQVSEQEEIIEIDKLIVYDTIFIRNEEVIPCDSELLSDETKIDYSYVTGESLPVIKKKGDFIYAGGKLIGQRAKFKVLKECNRSQLTQIWNTLSPNPNENKSTSKEDKLSFFFLLSLLILSFTASIFWAFKDPSKITQIVVSILIVACPCALALSRPFTFGNVIRILGRKGLYLKNTSVIEHLNGITDIVFDKTGTLTTGILEDITYEGTKLTEEQLEGILILSNSSTHPLSRGIVRHIKNTITLPTEDCSNFKEISGKGIQGEYKQNSYIIGSSTFTDAPQFSTSDETSVHIAINNTYYGKFIFNSKIREGISETILKLSDYRLHVLSGDNEKDKDILSTVFPLESTILFNQSPLDKSNYVEKLKKENCSVLMIGDGLNDSGALGKADVGIAVSEDIFQFTPTSDAILEANKLNELFDFLKISKYSKKVLTTCLSFSISYNVIGLSIALSGTMSPLVAAILMPISSITVVGLSTFLVLLKGKN
jgi:Cu+-exporting ATPase